MSLKLKFIIISFITFALYTAVDFITGRFVIFPSFIALEMNEAKMNSDRIIQALKREIFHLDSFCHDWSAWDKTYAFAVDRSSEYILANLPVTTFTDNQIDLIYICDAQGTLLLSHI